MIYEITYNYYLDSDKVIATTLYRTEIKIVDDLDRLRKIGRKLFHKLRRELDSNSDLLIRGKRVSEVTISAYREVEKDELLTIQQVLRDNNSAISNSTEQELKAAFWNSSSEKIEFTSLKNGTTNTRGITLDEVDAALREENQ